jgi:hypothetical protein
MLENKIQSLLMKYSLLSVSIELFIDIDNVIDGIIEPYFLNKEYAG